MTFLLPGLELFSLVSSIFVVEATVVDDQVTGRRLLRIFLRMLLVVSSTASGEAGLAVESKSLSFAFERFDSILELKLAVAVSIVKFSGSVVATFSRGLDSKSGGEISDENVVPS